MKYFLNVIALAGSAMAFPSREAFEAFSSRDLHPRGLVQQITTPEQGVGALPFVPPPFDAASQLVSVTGDHAVSPIYDTYAPGILSSR